MNCNSIKSNYHTHTLRCKHADGTARDYVEKALELKMDIIGFSEHAPFEQDPFDCRMDYAELDEYLDTLDGLKDEFDGQLKICKGLEIEYLEKYTKYYEYLLQDKKIEYFILGEHIFETPSGEYGNIFLCDSTEPFVDYAKAIARALPTGMFAYLAHPDVFMINRLAWDYNCDKATDIILEAVTKNGTPIEYNANGIRRKIQDPSLAGYDIYPHINFWEKAFEAKLPIIVGSDAHEPAAIWDESMDEAYSILTERGVTPITELKL